jgi:aminocarboxymuconate-semialdehyde decarboxylase
MSPTVDMHAHVIPPTIAERARAERLWHGLDVAPVDGSVELTFQGRSYRWGARYWSSPTERLAQMAARGVDVEVLSASGPLLRYSLPLETSQAITREVNDHLQTYAAQAPGRFALLATLPLQDPLAAADELETVMRTPGFVGAVVGASVPAGGWASPVYEPVIATAERTGAILMLHPTPMEAAIVGTRYGLQDLLGQPQEIFLAWCDFALGGVLDRHPRLRLYLAQGGGLAPLLVGRLDHGALVRSDMPTTQRRAEEYIRTCYYDTLTYSEGALRLLLDVAGADNVLLGSDFPSYISIADAAQRIRAMASLAEAEKRQVLGQNAQRLLGSAISA